MKRRWHSRDARGTSASRPSSSMRATFREFRTLHSDPRFAAILREMDSPLENEKKRS